MPRFIALLRAINVGGRNVTMAALRAQFEALGFFECRNLYRKRQRGIASTCAAAKSIGAVAEEQSESSFSNNAFDR